LDFQFKIKVLSHESIWQKQTFKGKIMRIRVRGMEPAALTRPVSPRSRSNNASLRNNISEIGGL